MYINFTHRFPNSNGNAGTDHGWAGHYFAIGGGLKGGKILGKYPNSITRTLRPAPTSPWDSVWFGVAEWAGSDNLAKVCPHMHRFEETDMFDSATMFRATGPTLAPSLSPTSSPLNPTSSPSSGPTVSPSSSPLNPTSSPSSSPSKAPVTPSPTTGSPSLSQSNAPVVISPPETIRKVRVQLTKKEHLHMREVEVIDANDQNVALNKAASQSSTWEGALPASNAVDGIMDNLMLTNYEQGEYNSICYPILIERAGELISKQHISPNSSK